jgi:predicted AAA+ superfamily ATPase
MRDIELVLENIVCMELLSRGYSVTVGKIGQAEIDFAAEKHGEPLYIQVCYLLAEEKTIAREFGSLAAVKDNFPKLVLSMDEIDLSRDGIRHMNVRDFLLQAEDAV